MTYITLLAEASHRQNYEKCPVCFWKKRKFPTKWYTKLCS